MLHRCDVVPLATQVDGRLRLLAEEQPQLLTWLKEEQGTSQRLAVRLRAASEDAAAKEEAMQVSLYREGARGEGEPGSSLCAGSGEAGVVCVQP